MISGKRFDFVTCIISAVAGLLWAFIGRALLNALSHSVWMPLLVGLYFVGLALMLILALWLCTLIKGRVMPERGSYPKAFALTALVLLLALLFQWVYSRDFNMEEVVPTGDSSYIFLVDESGSMLGNDMNNERGKAIQNLMAKCEPDFPCAVYGFESSFRQISPMLPASVLAVNPLELGAYGGTNISDAIEYVLQEIESGNLRAGLRPHIILVTDGVDTGGMKPLKATLRHANDANVRVSTVGVGNAVDAEYLRNIAVKTEGNYVTCETMSDLLGSITDITEQESSDYQRTLLNTREEMPHDWVYAVMRILFLLILAVPFLIIKSLLLRTNDANTNVLIPNLILLLIGALSVEIGMNQFLLKFLKEFVVQSILCIGFTILIVTEIKESPWVDPDPWDSGDLSGRPKRFTSSGSSGGRSSAGKASGGGSGDGFDDW